MNVTAFFDRQVVSFRARDWAVLVDDYAYPFAIYFEDRIATFRTRHQIRDGLKSYDRTLRAFGVARGVPDVAAVSLPRRGQQVAWVTWRHFDSDGLLLSEIPTRYYLCAGADGRPRIQLLEFTRIAHAPMVGALSQEFMAA